MRLFHESHIVAGGRPVWRKINPAALAVLTLIIAPWALFIVLIRWFV